MSKLKEINDLFYRYLNDVKGLGLKEQGMIYKIKFIRLGLKYIAEVGNVYSKKEAVKKLKDYAGEDIKIVKVKLFNEWQKITLI